MKQLKFMLAAATAIGFAAAGQAEDFQSTNFESEKLTVGAQFPGVTNDKDNNPDGFGWEVTAPTANASEIVAATEFGNKDLPAKFAGGTHSKALAVSTDENPLLRHLKTSDEGAALPQSLANGSIYIDTMVQFTPTAADATIPSGDNDKLLIYLKEDNTLRIRSSYFKKGFYDEDEDETYSDEHDKRDVGVLYVSGETVPTIQSKVWYRLTVVASKSDSGTTLFAIFIDGNQVMPDEDLNGDKVTKEEGYLFPAINANTDSDGNIESVGFAGEGMVDDLVMTTENPFGVDSVDFTLVLGTGVSAVEFTIGENSYSVAKPEVDKIVSDLDVNGIAKITAIKYEDYYTSADGDFIVGSEIPLNKSEVRVNVKASTKLEEVTGEVTVDEAKSAYGVAATAPILANENVTAADIAKILNWSNKVDGGKRANIDTINFTSAGVPYNSPSAEAYLLDCATADVEKEKEEFKFTAEDLAKLMDPENTTGSLSLEGKGYNGKLTFKGAFTLGGENNWQEVSDSEDTNGKIQDSEGNWKVPNFFKAVLTFK